MTDAEIVALERVLSLAEESALDGKELLADTDSRWPEAVRQRYAIRTVRDFLETRGYGVPSFESDSPVYLPDAKELESFRADRDAESYAFHLTLEDIESEAVEWQDKAARRAAFNGAA
jgi:hypothetical protein